MPGGDQGPDTTKPGKSGDVILSATATLWKSLEGFWLRSEARPADGVLTGHCWGDGDREAGGRGTGPHGTGIRPGLGHGRSGRKKEKQPGWRLGTRLFPGRSRGGQEPALPQEPRPAIWLLVGVGVGVGSRLEAQFGSHEEPQDEPRSWVEAGREEAGHVSLQRLPRSSQGRAKHRHTSTLPDPTESGFQSSLNSHAL